MPFVRVTPELLSQYGEAIQQRIADESERYTVETGQGFGRLSIGYGAIERAISEGAFIYVGQADVAEGHRIIIWAHREQQGIFIDHVWGPSERALGLLLYIAQRLTDAGFGQRFGHFPNNNMPVVVQAKNATRAVAGRYGANGVTWTNTAAGNLLRVRIDLGLSRLIAAGAPVEV